MTSKLIKWSEHDVEIAVYQDYTWEGRTTDRYIHYKGARRRMIVAHSVAFPEYAIWQADCECELLD